MAKQTIEYKVGIYLRLSQEDMRSGESLSIEHQREIVTKFVSEQGWTIVDEYADDSYSGTDFSRPNVQRLLDDAQVGKINVIVCKDLSRFGRNYIEVGRYIDNIFPMYNIRFIALGDSIDTADRGSNAMEMMPTEVFTEPTIKGKLNVNAMKAQKHLYDHIVYDSTNEHDFATELDTNKSVAVYVKLPNGFYISTPVGKYNPDWTIAFYEGEVKHIYFIAETKGSMSTMQLREIEKGKIHSAKEHFKAISSDSVVYDVVDSYSSLWEIISK